jgi:hypothetical protein
MEVITVVLALILFSIFSFILGFTLGLIFSASSITKELEKCEKNTLALFGKYKVTTLIKEGSKNES